VRAPPGVAEGRNERAAQRVLVLDAVRRAGREAEGGWVRLGAIMPMRRSPLGAPWSKDIVRARLGELYLQGRIERRTSPANARYTEYRIKGGTP
jgi:hypothetical protein